MLAVSVAGRAYCAERLQPLGEGWIHAKLVAIRVLFQSRTVDGADFPDRANDQIRISDQR